eukprot:Rhum_TRINITY_DN15219_c2_g1::Rhum_TRINITY_DN15219_c2_g1_i6::g.145524::m.145524
MALEGWRESERQGNRGRGGGEGNSGKKTRGATTKEHVSYPPRLRLRILSQQAGAADGAAEWRPNPHSGQRTEAVKKKAKKKRTRKARQEKLGTAAHAVHRLLRHNRIPVVEVLGLPGPVERVRRVDERVLRRSHRVVRLRRDDNLLPANQLPVVVELHPRLATGGRVDVHRHSHAHPRRERRVHQAAVAVLREDQVASTGPEVDVLERVPRNDHPPELPVLDQLPPGRRRRPHPHRQGKRELQVGVDRVPQRQRVRRPARELVRVPRRRVRRRNAHRRDPRDHRARLRRQRPGQARRRRREVRHPAVDVLPRLRPPHARAPHPVLHVVGRGRVDRSRERQGSSLVAVVRVVLPPRHHRNRVRHAVLVQVQLPVRVARVGALCHGQRPRRVPPRHVERELRRQRAARDCRRVRVGVRRAVVVRHRVQHRHGPAGDCLNRVHEVCGCPAVVRLNVAT